LLECPLVSTAASNRVRVTYSTDGASDTGDLAAAEWTYDVVAVDTPACTQTTLDVSSLFMPTFVVAVRSSSPRHCRLAPAGQYLNQKCTTILNADTQNSYTDESSCYGYTSYTPQISYTSQ